MFADGAAVTSARPEPTATNPVVSAAVDPELAHEGFIYRLASGTEGDVLMDEVLEYNRDLHVSQNYTLAAVGRVAF